MNKPVISIAIADDHTLFRQTLARIISLHDGYQVNIIEPNGQALINTLTSLSTLPNICLLDINMPIMNGYETALYITQKMPSIKIIALSMFTDEFPVINMLHSGACAFIDKDADPGRLLSIIDSVNTYGYYLDGIARKHLPHGLNSLKNKRYDISPKEMQFLKLCASDKTYTEIANEMNVGKRTIENYRDSLFKKLDVNTRTALAVLALNSGLMLKH